MPARISELEIMDEDRLTEEVLDKFVNCHEQTYEEFLSTFPHLSKEDNVTKRGAFGTDSSENVFPSEEEQIVIDEGQKVGSTFQGDLNRAGKVKVDNFLDLEDLDIDEETQPQMSKESEILPECYGMKSALPFPVSPSLRKIRGNEAKICCCFQEKWRRTSTHLFHLTFLRWPSPSPLRSSWCPLGEGHTKKWKRYLEMKFSPSHLMKNLIMML
ncbi:intraflagellar transport-associated protein isoform X3 [Panthera leo]|uniref:intraflagellar transport-associated protein isoform X3 n=1 Tax=Panthera leo TaxID=9689 RepID=UPI001C69D12A|nr:intraflagellar transport-associated protein isoform X3 [Panthera leo]